MTKFNTFLKWVFGVFAIAAIVAGCNNGLKDDVDDLKDRVESLEDITTQLQNAVSSGKLITAVNPIAETSTTPAGWEIVFSDNKSIKIYNGLNAQKGNTPYMWVNSAGNWALNLGTKPANSDNSSYELKVGGKSVKAYGGSVRTKNSGGYIAIEEYDTASGEIKSTVVTAIPYDSKSYITIIVETEEAVIFSVNEKDYLLAKEAVFPASITVIRDKDYVIKGGTVEFDIAVNPSTNKVYPKENFELDYEVKYAPTRGITPDFIKIKDVKPSDIKGQYKMTLEWAESNTEFAKDAAIFIILNFKDMKGTPAKVISATPVIMNEKYVTIKDENVLAVNDIVMFTDETFTDSIRLSNYHQGYVKTVDFAITPNPSTDPKAVNDPFRRYINPNGDKYKFTVEPILGTNTTVWPDGVYSRLVDVKTSVTDYGRAAVPETPAKPEIGQPAIPGVPAINPVTIDKNFKITVYKVPQDNIIYIHDFEDRWIPNKVVDYRLSVALSTEFAKSGYATAAWNFAIKSQTLKKGTEVIGMEKNITADETKFNATNSFSVGYKLLPTINAGSYSIELAVTATPKTPRPAELKQSREFKVVMNFRIVAPTFTININNPSHTIIPAGSDTYATYKLADVKITDLLDVESTKNISKAIDVTPNVAPLGYEFDTNPRHGAQGVRFNPYPTVTAPAIADWGSLTSIKKPIQVIVKLDTGQEIPVMIMCQNSPAEKHAVETIYVQYNRLNLDHVTANNAIFKGNYNAMINTGINIAANGNFTPESIGNIALDPTMIKTSGGIVFTEIGTVQCQGGPLPKGLDGKKILSIDPASGLVKSIDGMTWENPDAVLFQTFRVTYTDIWGNSAFKDVNVYVKSNSVPN